ncbi:hypothetical protein SAMN05518672_113119 [Chitinophaga sp. CF118]|uniref:DUF6345 domain-containing protein n=1 Tax=Chitinophaga sp. CF118 TaxID=1884367 RepID=UPI0008E4B9F1|nr:DUF6345 domain-containing protein [Chitinophaga sp. CF118]SFE97759.1 hypothetical protein SAMN05518672_113119 [Chitinophaga sp. CF118]
MKRCNPLFSRARTLFVVFMLSCFAVNHVKAADREIGGYVDQAEDRFVRNVWNFIKNFQGWQSVGGNRWQEVQYFWAEPFEFNTNHQDFVDRMDLAYVAAHGSAYSVQTKQTPNTGVDLRSCPPYGDLSTGGDLEFMIIESCSTVASAPEAPAGGDWWTPWNPIFQGLHQLAGFRTLSYSDNGIPNRFANKLKANGGIWQSWFSAVDGERTFYSNGTYSEFPGYASAIIYTSTENDRLGSYAGDPAGGTAGMKTWWQF